MSLGGRGWKQRKLFVSHVCLDFISCSHAHSFICHFSFFTFCNLAGHRCFGAGRRGRRPNQVIMFHASAPTNTHAHTPQQQQHMNLRCHDTHLQIHHVCAPHRLPLPERGAHTQNKDRNANHTHDAQMTSTQTHTRAHMKMRAHAACVFTKSSSLNVTISPHTHLFFARTHQTNTHTVSDSTLGNC